MTTLVVISVIGLLLIALDIFFIPGGIVAFFGLLCMAFSVYRSYELYDNSTGHIFLAATVAGSSVLVYFLFRPGVWKRVSQHAEISGRMNTQDVLQVKVGDRGITLSALRPSGKVNFNGYEAEAAVQGSIADPGTTVEVIAIEQNKIIVHII